MTGSNDKFTAILMVRVRKWCGGHPNKYKRYYTYSLATLVVHYAVMVAPG